MWLLLKSFKSSPLGYVLSPLQRLSGRFSLNTMSSGANLITARVQFAAIIAFSRYLPESFYRDRKAKQIFNITINSLLSSPPLFLLGEATVVFRLGEDDGLYRGDCADFRAVAFRSLTGEGVAILACVVAVAFTGVVGVLLHSSVKSKVKWHCTSSVCLACLVLGSSLEGGSEKCLFKPRT